MPPDSDRAYPQIGVHGALPTLPRVRALGLDLARQALRKSPNQTEVVGGVDVGDGAHVFPV